MTKLWVMYIFSWEIPVRQMKYAIVQFWVIGVRIISTRKKKNEGKRKQDKVISDTTLDCRSALWIVTSVAGHQVLRFSVISESCFLLELSEGVFKNFFLHGENFCMVNDGQNGLVSDFSGECDILWRVYLKISQCMVDDGVTGQSLIFPVNVIPMEVNVIPVEAELALMNAGLTFLLL